MRTTSKAMQIVKRTDRNTRALAKVASAIAWIRDEKVETEYAVAAVALLEQCQFQIVQERRNLRASLWDELAKQE